MGIVDSEIQLLRNEILPRIERRRSVLCLGVPTMLDADLCEIDPHEVFSDMGFSEVVCLDANGWEGAGEIHDLNQPLPNHLCNRFDLVVDPGTMEHVFDIRRALWNVADALAIGGIAFHKSPLNLVNHGFYSLSPTFYHDGYAACGIDDVRCWIRIVGGGIEFRPYQPNMTIEAGPGRWLVLAAAQRMSKVEHKTPTQGRCRELWNRTKQT